MRAHGLVRPFIIVCPTGRMPFWVDKCARDPSFRVLLNQGTPKDRCQALRYTKFDILITSYTLAIKDLKFLRKIAWQITVWDDGVRELQRGWRKASATHNLQGALSCRSKKMFCILLSPTRVTDLKSVNWLVSEHLGSMYSIFNHDTLDCSFDTRDIRHGSWRNWIHELANELALHFAAPRAKGLEECTTIAEETLLAAKQLTLDKVCRPPF